MSCAATALATDFRHRRYEKSGLILGEMEETDEQVFVGLNFDRRSGRIAVKSERIWRLRLAGEELLRRGNATGEQMRRYLGHVTWAMLMRKECLCLVSAAYRFVSWSGPRRCQLWPAVRREIRWISSILPLLYADTRRQWWGTLYASDSSGGDSGGNGGFGVCVRGTAAEEVADIGRRSEQ